VKEKVEKFLSILKIELLDVEEDIAALQEFYKQREKNREITSYVLLGNVAVIQREIRAIKRIVDKMEDISPESYSTLDELVSDLEGKFREQLIDGQVPNTIFDILKRKLLKVAEYVRTV